MRTLANSDQRLGLVAFEEQTYELLPPGRGATRSARCFASSVPRARRSGARRPGRSRSSAGRTSALVSRLARAGRRAKRGGLGSPRQRPPGLHLRPAAARRRDRPVPHRGSALARAADVPAAGQPRSLHEPRGQECNRRRPRSARERRRRAAPECRVGVSGLGLPARHRPTARAGRKRICRPQARMEPVMSRRALVIRAAAAAFLAWIGVLSTLAARDVLAWRHQTAHADVAVASFSPDLGVWRPHTWFAPRGVSQWLVGAGDDVEFRTDAPALQLFRGHQQWGLFRAQRVQRRTDRTRPPHARVGSAGVQARPDRPQLAQRRVALARATASRDPALSAFDPSKPGMRRRLSSGTISDFTEAVRLDPGNATAKYDLEGLL